MKKIFFSDKYGLTAAVISETKTMFRQFVPQKLLVEFGHNQFSDKSYELIQNAPYKVGETYAVAQSYFDIKTSANSYRPPFWDGYKEWHAFLDTLPKCGAGYYNKMATRAEFMPWRILIANVRVERLQDISEVDCIREGVYDLEPYGIRPKFTVRNLSEVFFTEKEAYAALIDAIYGNGTWDKNPWVYVYNFKLIKK